MFGFLRDLAEKLAYPFVRMAEALGEPIRNLGSALEKIGVKLEVDRLQRIEDTETEAIAATEKIVGAGMDELPDIGVIPEAITKQRREYAWVVQIDAIDRVTGVRSKRFITISTDERLTPNEAIAEAHDVLSDDYGIERDTIVSSEITRHTKAGPAGTL